MITIRPGSHVHTLLTVLSFVGEYPVTALGLLGSVRSYKDLIHKLSMPQEFRFPDSEERFICRLLTVSGKGKRKTIRLHKSALPLLKYWDEDAYALFDLKVRSYNRGSFTYDAHENGEFQFSFLDGNIWRLFRFREAILNREGKFKIICYPEQLPFLRKYMGNLAKISTVTMENAERVLKIKEKSLI